MKETGRVCKRQREYVKQTRRVFERDRVSIQLSSQSPSKPNHSINQGGSEPITST